MRVALVAIWLAALAPAAAQEVTIEGVARSASLMRQILDVCGPPFDVDRDLAERTRRAFVQAGESAYGKAKFDAVQKDEDERRAREARAMGSDRWCAAQKDMLGEAAGFRLFR